VEPSAAFVALHSRSSLAFWLDSGVAATTGFSYLGAGDRLVTASLAEGGQASGVGVDGPQGDIFE
jgi:hypothetical protein